MHNGFVVDADGEKMSKSLGNVSKPVDLIESLRRRAYRMVLLQSPLPQPGEGHPVTTSTAPSNGAGRPRLRSRPAADLAGAVDREG